MADYPISNVARRIVYTGSAGVGPYAFNFEVLANTDLNVYKNDVLLTLTTDYTVTISPTLGTGSITLVVAATGADRITIVGARAIQRTTDFTTGGDFFANTLNDEMDSQTILVQQVAETAERSIKAPVTDPTSISMVLPNNTTRANKFLSFNSSGNPQALDTLGTYRGNWAAGTAYVLQDVVKDTSNNNIYVCITAHTSTGTQPISSNADVAKWGLIVDSASATSSASAAASSASAASSSASAASTSASNASTSASNASTSASTATTQASNASASATAAAASYDSFDDRYLGSKSSNPTLDNDGNALLTGALYFNSVSNAMKVWSGSVWLDASLSPVNISSIRTTATSGQTVITGLSYTTGTNSLVVYVNGSKQISSVNYNETSSSSITFLTGLNVGDTVECLVTAYQVLGSGAVTGVAATAPIASTGGTNPTLSIPQATASVDGYLSATNWTTFNNKSNTNGTVTSIAALTLGTTGTDLSSTVANGTTTPVITLQVPTASATNRGALSSTDWSIFNGKQATLVSGTSIKTVNGATLLGSGDVGTISVPYGGTGLTTLATGYIPYGNGTGAFSSSNSFIFTSGKLGVGTNAPNSTVEIRGSFGGFTSSVTSAGSPLGSQIYIGDGAFLGSAAYFLAPGLGAVYDATQSIGAALAFYTYAGARSERVRVHASGGVSIGNTTDKGASSLNVSGLIYPQQATTAGAPAYVKGAIYFDTTLNKLRVGGATAWETITSV